MTADKDAVKAVREAIASVFGYTADTFPVSGTETLNRAAEAAVAAITEAFGPERQASSTADGATSSILDTTAVGSGTSCRRCGCLREWHDTDTGGCCLRHEHSCPAFIDPRGGES